MNRGQADMLRSALELADRGWHVFPCALGGKQPALRGNWQNHATTDPDRIRAWWAGRAYNIGISCGPSGLVVVDLDVPKDHGRGQASGVASLARLCRQSGQRFPLQTFTVATPSGGFHLYFTATGHQVRNSAGSLGLLIDIRADGGYVIGPGSHVDGRAYRPHNTFSPAPLPGWIAEALEKPPPEPVPSSRAVPEPARATAWALAALREETRRMATAVDGTRHDTLNRAAFNLGQLVGSGFLPELAVVSSLTDATRQSGLPERDINRIIHSGMTAGTRHPRVPRQNPPSRSPGPRPSRLSRDGPAASAPRPAF